MIILEIISTLRDILRSLLGEVFGMFNPLSS